MICHNRMLLCSLSGVACTTPDTSKSQPTAYCFAQLKQGTCLIRLNRFYLLPPPVENGSSSCLIYRLLSMLWWCQAQKVFGPIWYTGCFAFHALAILLMPTNCSAAKQLPQFCKHSKSADLLRKSLLSHVWRVPSSKALSCKHERLFDLLTLASTNGK